MEENEINVTMEYGTLDLKTLLLELTEVYCTKAIEDKLKE